MTQANAQSLTGREVLVTGAATGIGDAAVQVLRSYVTLRRL
jgi:NAD(P)-dependent dehydrogenase (short-subunit alcohol dehydrogenase family)